MVDLTSKEDVKLVSSKVNSRTIEGRFLDRGEDGGEEEALPCFALGTAGAFRTNTSWLTWRKSTWRVLMRMSGETVVTAWSSFTCVPVIT